MSYSNFSRRWTIVLLFLIRHSYSLRLWDYYKERTFQCVPIQEKYCAGIVFNDTVFCKSFCNSILKNVHFPKLFRLWSVL